jgi:hypothetical protein
MFALADHARRRLKFSRMAIAHPHARTHATSAMSRFDVKIKNHAAKAQQRNARSFQPAPPGPGSARARAVGARTIARNPKIRRLSLSMGSIREPPSFDQEQLNGDDNCLSHRLISNAHQLLSNSSGSLAVLPAIRIAHCTRDFQQQRTTAYVFRLRCNLVTYPQAALAKPIISVSLISRS